jgi:ribosomal protein L11 methyltransferase
VKASKYVFVHLYAREENFDKVTAFLTVYPILGIEERNDELIVSFNENDWMEIDQAEFLHLLRFADSEIKILKIENIQERNWNEEWEKNIAPVIISKRIGIVPSWRIGETGSEIEIIIDPKMSFGTGHHSTTRLMCQLAERLVKPDSFWIDVGTGTGILAILAKKLRAKEVLAIDNNAWSMQNALENFRLNSILDGIDLIELDIDAIPSLPESDGIFANLNLDVILRNLNKFYNSISNSDGHLLVSGILKYDLDECISKIVNSGFNVQEILYDEEWVALHLRVRRQKE